MAQVQDQSRQLIAGMSGKAEIVVVNRCLIEFIFESLRQLTENYSDVPEINQRLATWAMIAPAGNEGVRSRDALKANSWKQIGLTSYTLRKLFPVQLVAG